MLLKVFNFLIVTFAVASCQKNGDESRPYEFGFTIDGQQHRHEKKDVNGIIQGEFGFITADGIYHVTVYATDENGNFKILSMRNVRISAPLDGSPLPPGQKIAEKPEGSQAQAQPQPQPEIQQTTVKSKTPYVFTTQPTIKPACAGCGYVTTQKPGQKFQFQNPAFQNATPDVDRSITPVSSSQPDNVPNQQNSEQPPQIDAGVADIVNNPASTPNIPENPQTDNESVNLQNPNSPNVPTSVDSKRSSYPNSQTINNSAGPNEVDITNKKPLSQVTISNGSIHVPGNPDIPIRDKFPGMVDGLPDGISEKDITGLLYKFNYTVGFHGHYEKGLKNGAKIGGYFVTGRDGISRIVTYVADENGFRPKVKFVRLDLNSDEVPKEGTEKKFGLKNFEFVWYPIS